MKDGAAHQKKVYAGFRKRSNAKNSASVRLGKRPLTIKAAPRVRPNAMKPQARRAQPNPTCEVAISDNHNVTLELRRDLYDEVVDSNGPDDTSDR